MAESVEFWFMLLMFGLDFVSIIELASMKMPMGFRWGLEGVVARSYMAFATLS